MNKKCQDKQLFLNVTQEFVLTAKWLSLLRRIVPLTFCVGWKIVLGKYLDGFYSHNPCCYPSLNTGVNLGIEFNSLSEHMKNTYKAFKFGN